MPVLRYILLSPQFLTALSSLSVVVLRKEGGDKQQHCALLTRIDRLDALDHCLFYLLTLIKGFLKEEEHWSRSC